ncbi:MAG: AAC(3)-I family aminoglycoside N-acetyltransferase [Pseudomonadota bacterium]
MTIRKLTASDADTMQSVIHVFGEAFEDPDNYHKNPPSADYLARFLAKDHVIVLAAMDEDTVTGALVAYELEKFEQARSEIYIYDLAVAQAHRRRGIATAMIGELQRVAAERGAWVIFVQTDDRDPPAIALYDKLGVREEVLHFEIPPKG